jgi:hypothetical protein
MPLSDSISAVVVLPSSRNIDLVHTYWVSALVSLCRDGRTIISLEGCKSRTNLNPDELFWLLKAVCESRRIALNVCVRGILRDESPKARCFDPQPLWSTNRVAAGIRLGS